MGRRASMRISLLFMGTSPFGIETSVGLIRLFVGLLAVAAEPTFTGYCVGCLLTHAPRFGDVGIRPVSCFDFLRDGIMVQPTHRTDGIFEFFNFLVIQFLSPSGVGSQHLY